MAEGRGFISGFGTESVIIVHVTWKVKKKKESLPYHKTCKSSKGEYRCSSSLSLTLTLVVGT